MTVSRALDASCALAAFEHRADAAVRLARELGAEALLILVVDPELGALVPAPGFPGTLPGGREWRAFLQRCGTAGGHRAELPWPDLETLAVADAKVLEDGSVFILLGGDPGWPDPESLALPLVSAALKAEAQAASARGQVAVERDAARHATALADALDGTRRALENALTESARLNTALQAAARERAELLANEQAASRAKDEFLAMLGHELRNPLAPITTALQLIRLRGGSPQLEREHAIIERQVVHLTRLVDDLLDVARIARGKVALKRVPVKPSAVVARAIEMTSPLIESRRHRLSLDVADGGYVIDVDAGRLAQVVSNLLTNAARYTPEGGHIQVSVRCSGEWMTLRVKDDGVGIDPASLEAIFELFAQGARTKDRGEGGLGLGLSIVRNLVRMHGGVVRADSEGLGRGSEFVVELPARQVGSNVAQAAGAPPVTPPRLAEVEPVEVPARARLRVLVVDDNVDAAELLAEVLELHDCEVAICHDGPRALELTQRFVPDLAILDIGLPVMDGLELARRLRARPELAHVRLIALTGYGQDSDRRATATAGFDHHMVKPVSIDELIQLIGRGRVSAAR